jgi:CBS-domain-containing membrane protein
MTETEKDAYNCELTDADLLAALKEMGRHGGYVDVTIKDLKTIYSLAQAKARQRKRKQGRQEETRG